MILITKKNSKINSIEEFKGKKRVLTAVETSASIFGMLSSHGIREGDIKIVNSANEFEDFLNDKIDILSAYSSNETYRLRQRGVEINVFDPKDYGFNFYSDILFTSKQELQNHKQRVVNFTKASLKGWDYALSNLEETVEVISKKYNSQNKTLSQIYYEAIVLKELAYKNTHTLGKIEKEKLQQIYDTYKVMGLIKKQIDIDAYRRA